MSIASTLGVDRKNRMTWAVLWVPCPSVQPKRHHLFIMTLLLFFYFFS